MLAMQAARARGATVFAVDTRQLSLDLARELGAEAVVDPATHDPSEQLARLTDGLGPDIVIDAAGAPETPEMAVRAVRRGGLVVLVAIYTSRPEFDFNNLVSREVRVAGSLAYEQQDVEEAVRLISAGLIRTKPLISEIIPLEQVIDRGFARMMAPAKDVFRILVSPR